MSILKVISTYIALAVILIITLSTGFFVFIWHYRLIQEAGEKVEKIERKSLDCQFGGLIIYAETINCSRGLLNFSIKNSGYIDLYDIKVLVSDSNRVRILDAIDRSTNRPITVDNPLKPFNVSNLYVNISGINVKFIEIYTQCKNVNSGKIDILCT